MARAIVTTQKRRRATWEPLYDTDPHTGTTLEVFYADQVLAGAFGAEGAGLVDVPARLLADHSAYPPLLD